MASVRAPGGRVGDRGQRQGGSTWEMGGGHVSPPGAPFFEMFCFTTEWEVKLLLPKHGPAGCILTAQYSPAPAEMHWHGERCQEQRCAGLLCTPCPASPCSTLVLQHVGVGWYSPGSIITPPRRFHKPSSVSLYKSSEPTCHKLSSSLPPASVLTHHLHQCLVTRWK